ncbi:phosphotransferase [Staphylococcus chromogenes]|nr:phosphotransferase [Staphylococcus chromogenes]
MYEAIANARFFRNKSAGISSFTEVKRSGNWVVADIDGDLYQLLLDGEQDVLATEAGAKHVAAAYLNGQAFGAGELHQLTEELIPADATPQISRAEQSNTSVVFGSVMVKFFRKLEPGINPDVELLEGLARVGCQHAPRLRGYTTVDIDGEQYVTAMIQDFVDNAQEGWALTLDRAGSDLAAEARLMGAAVAAVHDSLRTAFGTEQRANAQLIEALSARLDHLVSQAPVLADYAPAARSLYAAASHGSSLAQRIHGDLHLGQILRSSDRYLLIDFEGEPARPLAQRRELMSPLQDIAGMLRSFDYARFVSGHELGVETEFLTAVGCPDSSLLLDAFVLDKALYEVAYEANNRPDWVEIPLSAVQRLTQR